VSQIKEPNKVEMDFDEWLKYGMENSFCGPPVCVTHDGEPMTDEELTEFEEGHDPCIHMIRPYHDVAERIMVESAHSPSIWRRPGWE
jgi:hypothetical protein